MSTYFIGDTHFGHSEIIKFENRPFLNVKDMDDTLIKNWNEAVCAEDMVFMIGDFSFYSDEKTKAILSLLSGHKILIKGNHDQKGEQVYRECGFESVYSYPIILEGFWMISHEPLYLNRNMPYANIYGHVHGNEIYKDVSEHSFCACAERIGYKPMEWSEIKRRMRGES